MKYILCLLLVTSLSSNACADELPKLVCSEISNDTIINSSFEHLGESEVKELYKVIDGKLFVSSKVHEEELIGSVSRMIGLKYQSGDKTIVFSNARLLEATVVEHGTMFIKVSKLHCTKI